MYRLLIGAGLGLGALGLGYLSMRTARFLGDKAAVGDLVFVPIASGGFPGVPAQAGQVVVRVDGTSGPDVLTGAIVGYALPGAAPTGYAPLPEAPGAAPVSVNRSVVTAVRRGGGLVS